MNKAKTLPSLCSHSMDKTDNMQKLSWVFDISAGFNEEKEAV